MSTTLVLGNGESRSALDLQSFVSEYTIVGCNALHRDISVDHLVCCDRRMVEEAVTSSSTLNTKIYVREDWYQYFRKIRKDKRIYTVPELPYKGSAKSDQPVHWGSGPYAVLLAAQLGFKSVILAGFDLYSINDKVNNIYKGTSNYSNSKSNPVDPSFWILQIGKVFEHYPDTDFIIWNRKDWKLPDLWKKSNVKFEHFS